MSNKRFLVFLLAAALATLAVLGGGCGGGSDFHINNDVNAAWNGAWEATGGKATLTVNGQSGVMSGDLSLLLENSNIADETGSTTGTLVLVINTPDGGHLPLLFDKLAFTTTRLSDDTWVATDTYGKGEFTVKMTSSTRAVLGATITETSNFVLELDNFIMEKKDLQQTVDVENALPGAWMTRTGAGGGFAQVNNGGTSALFVASRDYSVTAGFQFSDVSLSNKKMTAKGAVVMSGVNPLYQTSARFPFIYDSSRENGVVVLEHVMGDIYRVKLGSAVLGFLHLVDESRAMLAMRIILNPAQTETSNNWIAVSTAFLLTKASSSEDPTAEVGTTWDITDCKGFGGQTTTETTGLVTVDAGTLTLKATADLQVTLDVALSGNQTTASGSTAFTFTASDVPLDLEKLGGGMYLGTATRSNMSGQILMMVSNARTFFVASLRDTTNSALVSVGGQLTQQ